MTKEIQQILSAFQKVDFSQQKAALATVVHVQGSSYRRPGARMLITDDGNLTGAISGGCLEGDALRKARLVMHKGEATVVTYDTTDDDDAKLGIGLGCNGIIRILIEPIDPGKAANPIQLLQFACAKRQRSVLVTLFSLEDSRSVPPGTCCLLTKAGQYCSMANLDMQYTLKADAREAMETGKSITLTYPGKLTAFIECLEPVISLVIIGAGNDVVPLTEFAAILGWETIVLDGRPSHAKPERFPAASQVILAKPEQVLNYVQPDKRTYFLLMTHNYKYDLAVFRELLDKNLNYIGVLGPKKKLHKMLAECNDPEWEGQSPVYGPVGLDIGSESAEEIALAIVAEIKVVSAGKEGHSLRDLGNTIHHAF